MKRMTNLEVKHLVDEMQFLNGGMIDSICHRDKELMIRIVQENRYNFFISPDVVYLTDKDNVKDITEFAMLLRKYLKGKRIERIGQHNFDRIVEIWTDSNILILELDSANYILCDRSYKIIRPMEFQSYDDRNVFANERYVYPKSLDIRDIHAMKRLLGRETIIQLLSNFFGDYAKDALILAGVDRNKVSNQLSDDEIMRVKGNINLFIHGERKPQIIYKDDKIDLLLFDLETRKADKKKYFDSFTEALDCFLSSGEKIKTISKTEAKKRKKKKRKRLKKKKVNKRKR